MPDLPKMGGPQPSKKGPGRPKATREETPKTDIPRARLTPTSQKLRDKVALFYLMMGTFLVPAGRFYSPLTGIGNGLKEYSNEAADAWMELANENPEVKKVLESITAASAWGNVIGVHFTIATKINEDTEKIGQIMNDPIQQAREMGVPESEIQKAVNLAQGIVQSERSPDEAQPINVDPPITTAPPVNTTPRSGMPSPADMGVSAQGVAQSNSHENVIPHDASPPSGR